MRFTSLLRLPSAFVPIAMSLAAFVLIIVVVAVAGVVHHPDEGAPARIFQLLIALQVPVIAVFAIKWLPRSLWSSLLVLLLQIGAALAAVLTIMWLESSGPA